MAGVPKHDIHEAAARPLKRARAWAWTVFWVTAGSSVLYNCYHALVGQHMPWYTGVPEGFVPLLVAIGVLEFSGAWRENKVLQAAAWLVTSGAMAWSAFATNSVVHQGWAFGLIADTAALSAMYFLLNGPTAAQAVASVAEKIAELTTAADAERASREQAEAAHRAAVSDVRARAGAEIEARDRALADAAEALATARSDTEKATARVAVLERRLGGPARRSKAAPARSGTAPRSGTGTAPEDDLDLEARALKLLATNLDMSGAELAEKLGISAGYGRKLRRRLAGDRPAEDEADRPEDRTGTASGDRGEDRA
jgi:hypothetical protein